MLRTRWVAALTSVIGGMPTTVVLVAFLLETAHGDQSSWMNLLFVLVLLALGPLWLVVSSLALVTSGRSPWRHLLPLVISGILTVGTAGVLAASGPGGWIGWFLLAFLLLLVSLAMTIVLVVRKRHRA